MRGVWNQSFPRTSQCSTARLAISVMPLLTHVNGWRMESVQLLTNRPLQHSSSCHRSNAPPLYTHVNEWLMKSAQLPTNEAMQHVLRLQSFSCMHVWVSHVTYTWIAKYMNEWHIRNQRNYPRTRQCSTARQAAAVMPLHTHVNKWHIKSAQLPTNKPMQHSTSCHRSNAPAHTCEWVTYGISATTHEQATAAQHVLPPQ